MNSKALQYAIAAALVATGWPAAAQEQSSDCRAPGLQTHPLVDRGAALLSFEQLPEGCLKALFIECAEDAGVRILDLGSAAICSVGYEALLKRGFGGDFHALVGWWRRQNSETPVN
jgi:hypothetical protein